MSESTICDRYPKNVGPTSARDAVKNACNDIDFLDREPAGVCIPSGRGADVDRFLRDNCPDKHSLLKPYL